jgi:hypothetical protein
MTTVRTRRKGTSEGEMFDVRERVEVLGDEEVISSCVDGDIVIDG